VQRVAGGSAQGHVSEQATHTLFQIDSNEQQEDTKVIMCDSRADNMTIRIPHVLSTHPLRQPHVSCDHSFISHLQLLYPIKHNKNQQKKKGLLSVRCTTWRNVHDRLWCLGAKSSTIPVRHDVIVHGSSHKKGIQTRGLWQYSVIVYFSVYARRTRDIYQDGPGLKSAAQTAISIEQGRFCHCNQTDIHTSY
jgi:hypothetical protein